MKKIKVLLLAADPDTEARLALDEEAREIQSRIRTTELRGIDFETAWAVQPADLQTELLFHRPDVVHFSGHGTAASELILESNDRGVHPITAKGLTSLLGQFKGQVRLVVLNACFSTTTAEEVVKEVDFCIGMNRAVNDKAAIGFAASFYQALAAGESIRTAFNLGRSALMNEGFGDEDAPELLCRATLGSEADARLLTEDAVEKASPWWRTQTGAMIGGAATIAAAVIGLVPYLMSTPSTPASGSLAVQTAPPLTASPAQTAASPAAPVDASGPPAADKTAPVSPTADTIGPGRSPEAHSGPAAPALDPTLAAYLALSQSTQFVAIQDRQARRSAIIGYVAEMSAQADALTDIWEGIEQAAKAGKPVATDDLMAKAALLQSLEALREQLPKNVVQGESDDRWASQVIRATDDVLTKRRLLSTGYHEVVDALAKNSPAIFAGAEQPLDQLHRLVQELSKETAALQALYKALRTRTDL